jgi:hypothetical protein
MCSIPVHSFGVENQSVGIVLPSAKENVVVTRQIMELHVQNVRANTAAEVGCCVRYRYHDRILGNPVPEGEPVRVRATVRTRTEIYNEGIMKLVGEAGICYSRLEEVTSAPRHLECDHIVGIWFGRCLASPHKHNKNTNCENNAAPILHELNSHPDRSELPTISHPQKR